MQQAVTTFLLAFLSALATALCGFLVGKMQANSKKKQKEEEQSKLVEKGLMVLTRSDLMRLHDIFIRKGFCPMSIKASIEEEYEVYHNLGGNGIATQMMEEILALPDFKKQTTRKRSVKKENEEQ